jgi:hypothetical protein
MPRKKSAAESAILLIRNMDLGEGLLPDGCSSWTAEPNLGNLTLCMHTSGG